MLRETVNKSKEAEMGGQSAERVKYPGIGRAAELLACSRPHLWMVLEQKHHRKSKSLTRRWRELLRTHKWNGEDWIKRSA